MYQKGTYDDFDDVQACIDLERALTGKDELDNIYKHNDLEEMGIFKIHIDKDNKKHLFVSHKKKSKLQLGAIFQLQTQIKALQTELALLKEKR